MISVADLWKLLAESRLLTAEQCRQVAQQATQAQPDAAGDPQRLAKWLVQANKISRYQARVLLAGRPGPFFYGDYCVYDRIEAGRLAGLFRAQHLATRQPVGLRFLTGPALQDADALRRLMPRVHAARQAGRQQPRISQCYHLADLGAYKFIVLEDLRGESLAERLARGKTGLATAEACRIVRHVALGLAALHARGHAHGQIRPDNLWLETEGCKLLQFPLLDDPLAPAAAPASIEAQVDYSAPELSSEAAASQWGDIYSLGCVLYQLLSGEAPFAGGPPADKQTRHAQETPTPITKRNPAVPAPLAQALGYLLEKSPERRYPDARAVAEALAPYAANDTASNAPTLPAYEAWLEQIERGRPATASAPVMAAPAPVASAAVAPAVAHAQPIGHVPGVANTGVAGPVAAFAAPAAIATPADTAAPASPVVSIVAEGGTPLAARRVKRGKSSATFGALALGALVVGGTAMFLWWSDQPAREQASANSDRSAETAAAEKSTALTPSASETSETAPLASASEHQEGIRSIEATIWQSPTDGQPLDLAYLAAGCQVIVALRPAESLNQPEWEKLVDPRTLGATSGWLTGELPKLTGKTLDQLESVLIGLLDASPGPPRVAMVARATEPFVTEEMLAAWGEAKAEEADGQTIYVTRDRGFFVPEQGESKILVIAPPADVRETVKQRDQPPPLRRELEVLAESSDADRQLTVLVAPNFLFSGGKALIADPLLDPLRGFFEIQDSDQKLELPKAAMLSAHLGEGNLFLELRIHDSFGGGSAAIAKQYRRRIARLPKQVSAYVRDLRLSDYSEPILWDYRDQLEVVDRFTRLGFEGKQIVLRAFLPEIAAHNLALGAHLALLETTGGPAAAPARVEPAKAETIADKLKKSFTLSVPNNPLDMTVEQLGSDLGIEIVILGTDLQQEGITKNQRLSFDERDKPVSEILQKIMLQANKEGKLVYVIKPKEGTDQEALYITTRSAVAKRGDKLPPELEIKK
ncbi:MAG TPA: serine/threonine-protein kinase [Pirellulales bacterium]